MLSQTTDTLTWSSWAPSPTEAADEGDNWTVVALVMAALGVGEQGLLRRTKARRRPGELTQSSQAAFAKLTSTVPLAKKIAPKGARRSCPSEGHQGRPRHRAGRYGEGALLKGR